MREPARPSSAPGWVWIPRFRFYTVLVFVALAMFVPILDFMRYGLVGDFWWVWNSGRWMAAHGCILTHNPASWNGVSLAGKPWVNLEWGWEWFLYAVDPHLHPGIFLAVLFVFELLMLLAFVWALRALAPELTPEVGWGLYALYALLVFPDTVRLRAELFSYAAFPFLLGLLWRARTNPGWLWVLAPLTGLWANIHGSWLMILVLVGLQALLSAFDRDFAMVGRLLFRGIVIPLLTVVVFTPFHLRTLTYALWLDHNRYITGYIQEWQSVNFHVTMYLVLGGLVLAAWVWRARSGGDYPLLLDLWFAGVTLAFFDEIRMIPYFGMVFALWMGYGLASRPRFQSWLSGARGQRVLRWGQVAGLTVAALASLGAARLMPHWVKPPVPSALVSWVTHHPHRVVLAPIDDGGYLEAHGVTGVFADGRSDFFLANGDRFQSYVSLVVNQDTRVSQVEAIFRAHQIDLVLWPSQQVTASVRAYLSLHHWQAEARSGGWTVFAPAHRRP